jgi:hypothetical protein
VIGWIYVAFLLALTILSLRSLGILGRAAPWTSLGWIATIGYDATASAEIMTNSRLPLHLPYWFLVALVIAFVVAGVRDEAQAEPWYWPTHLGLTRAERASSG